ncbi:MAG TPA: SDR family oxidoreductase, partial [Blastocatellia bacterium]|nr:SDR family oxidoreductase [Blastocatellia bacterium]
MQDSHHVGSDVDSNNELPGLRVAITGGTTGLGLALVREFLQRRARVAFVARLRERVESVARDHPGTHGIVGDVSIKDEIYPIALRIVGELGGLDVLINNASHLGPVPLALLGDTECEDLERALATNLLGPFRLTKALLGGLAASAREGRGAVVLNVSSDAAMNPYAFWGAYGASKAALHQLTLIWNEELSLEGVRFLSLDPGDMDTPLHELAVPGADPRT